MGVRRTIIPKNRPRFPMISFPEKEQKNSITLFAAFCFLTVGLSFSLLDFHPLFAGQDIAGESMNALEQEARQNGDAYGQAIAEYDRSIQLDPANGDAYYRRGTVHHKLDNLMLAIEDYSKAIELKPDLADAYYNRGTVYLRLGSFSRAQEDLHKAAGLNPKYADVYYDLAVRYGKLESATRERQDLVKTLELGRQNAYGGPQEDSRDGGGSPREQAAAQERLQELIWENERQRKELADAADLKKRLEELREENERQRKELAEAAEMKKRFDELSKKGEERRAEPAALPDVIKREAATDFNKTLEGPATAFDWFRKGYAAALSGNHQEAIEAFNGAIALNADFAEAYYVRGISYNNLGDPNRALQDMDKVIELDKEFAGAYYSRGLAYNKLSNRDKEMENYKAAAKLGFKPAQDYLKSQGVEW